MDGTPSLSLREQFFIAVRDLPGVEQRQQENIARGRNGTVQDAEQRLADIAATLPEKLEAFIGAVGDGKTRIASFPDTYRHDEEPLRFQITLPAQLEDTDAFTVFNRLMRTPAYRDIMHVLASPAIDMAARTSFLSDSIVGGGKPPEVINSLVIEIDPRRPAQKKTPAQKTGGPKS
ncbi:MAG: hypothetical protein PSY14_00615 [bacterium]|nr:hypothetical protein [bacterium]